MVSLRKSKPADALGKPIDPEVLYTPLVSHGRVIDGAPRVSIPR